MYRPLKEAIKIMKENSIGIETVVELYTPARTENGLAAFL